MILLRDMTCSTPCFLNLRYSSQKTLCVDHFSIIETLVKLCGTIFTCSSRHFHLVFAIFRRLQLISRQLQARHLQVGRLASNVQIEEFHDNFVLEFVPQVPEPTVPATAGEAAIECLRDCELLQPHAADVVAAEAIGLTLQSSSQHARYGDSGLNFQRAATKALDHHRRFDRSVSLETHSIISMQHCEAFAMPKSMVGKVGCDTWSSVVPDCRPRSCCPKLSMLSDVHVPGASVD